MDTVGSRRKVEKTDRVGPDKTIDFQPSASPYIKTIVPLTTWKVYYHYYMP
jgi:hypothetical protein